ncbi:DUF6168 family protein [Sinomicrobium sp.]
MKRLFFAFLTTLVVCTAVLYAIQYAVVNDGDTSLSLSISPSAIYGFHFLCTLVIFSGLLLVHRIAKQQTGNAFMAGSVLRMLASVLFLWPLIQKDIDPVVDVLAFFIPYFIFLAIEVFYVTKLLQNDKGGKNGKNL